MLTIQDNEFYVPINKYDAMYDYYNEEIYSVTGNNYNLLNVEFRKSVSADRAETISNLFTRKEDTVFHNYFINRIPMRFYTSPYGNGTTIGNRMSGI